MLAGLPDGVLLIIGLLLLVLGGELVVQGSIRIAGLLGMPSFLVGFTLVAIGTSLPELGVVLNAINRESLEAVDLAVGGSHRIQHRQHHARVGNRYVDRGSFSARQGPQAGCLDATHRYCIHRDIGRHRGVFTLAGNSVDRYNGRLLCLHLQDKGGEDQGELEDSWVPQGYSYAIISFLLGLLLVKYGSDFLIEGGVGLAVSLGVSEAVIGLTRSIWNIVARISGDVDGLDSRGPGRSNREHTRIQCCQRDGGTGNRFNRIPGFDCFEFFSDIGHLGAPGKLWINRPLNPYRKGHIQANGRILVGWVPSIRRYVVHRVVLV